MNVAAYTAVGKIDTINYVGPVNPGIPTPMKVGSKILHLIGLPRDFLTFSERRLHAIAGDVQNTCLPGARLNFFHGFTPWILTEPKQPYAAWSDCTFHDYIEFYHNRAGFNKNDLDRIERAEASWLKGAACVLFTSDWAATRARSQYGLDASRVGTVGIFGEVEMPERDVYAGGREFAFISTNFVAKGGPVVLTAFRDIRRRYPDVSLVVVGDRPRDATSEPGVSYAGFLRKEVPDERAKFRDILGRSRAVVHPTMSDIGPLLILEAGYFGCPVISSERFAIPELVDNGRSGILLEDQTDVALVAKAMAWMLDNEDGYRQMRAEAWTNARERHSLTAFEKRLVAYLQKTIDSEGHCTP